MATWQNLHDELALWRADSVVPTFWWRDDDATEPTPELDRLLKLSVTHGIPLHLAVIPHGATQALADRLIHAEHVDTLQHGWAHLNHEPKGQGASEMGASRDLALQRVDLARGWRRLSELNMPGLISGFAAPWNRVGPDTPALLGDLGYTLLSTSLQRNHGHSVIGLRLVNVHADPIRWRNGAEFRGTSQFLACVLDHLRLRRQGQVDRADPTGINTHHLETNEEVWRFLDRFCEEVGQSVRWVRMRDLLAQEKS